ncbi:hypothetical protein TC41_0223 [Alicyclobacillus acidocaldarius subsp. acidocaldarius Tc-4-1]|uniref:Uncharacterized protein n=1 Tax=Alicyclobacillus acidocaldarius (strain Tc-4-1) TaxID=1048834 RepID=F8IJ48_ALIAT|nr:hypothetical protein TC41_0223 [Alicyclobacillus acidocaldarius subsp. acidocaldarius Tc-4-1]
MDVLSKEQIRQLIRDGKLKDLHDVQSMLRELFREHRPRDARG